MRILMVIALVFVSVLGYWDIQECRNRHRLTWNDLGFQVTLLAGIVVVAFFLAYW